MSSTRQAHSTDLPISRHSLDMKLILVLSLVAYGYADKLDRTYLPPPGAATAGGSPGSLSAPGQGFGQQAPGFRGPQSQTGSFDTTGPSQPTGPSGFGNAGSSGRPGSNQPAGNGFGRPSGQGAFQSSGTGVQPPASQIGFGGQGQGFNQPQQPERPQASADRNAEILRYDNQNDGETFSYNFETSNGISAEESGVATNGVQAQGGFSYTGDDGQFYKITYTADENGYLPQGDHLPTPPPIPDEILRSIEENARAAASGTQEGAYNPDEDNSPQYNGNQGQQQFRGSNGFGPSGSAGQPSGPKGSGFNQGSQGSQGFNQGAQGSQGSFNQGAPQGQVFNQGSAAGNVNANQGFSGQRAQGGQAGYDYSRPQNQPSSRQPNGNANAIPTGPFKAPGSQNQGRPFNQNQQGQSGSQGRPFQQTTGSAANQKQYLAPEQRQPGNQGSAPQSFNQPQGTRQPGQSSGAQGQFNQNQGTRQSGQGPATQGQYNQNQGSGSQPSRGPSNFGQNRPTNQQQGFPPQRGSQGSQGPRGQANGGQDGYEYNRPQSGFNAGSQSRPQGPNVSRPQASFPGSGSQGQTGFPGSQSQTGFPSRPASQVSQGFPSAPGAKGQGQFGQQPQRPSNQESFSGPRQPPSFSPEEGYKY